MHGRVLFSLEHMRKQLALSPIRISTAQGLDMFPPTTHSLYLAYESLSTHYIEIVVKMVPDSRS